MPSQFDNMAFECDSDNETVQSDCQEVNLLEDFLSNSNSIKMYPRVATRNTRNLENTLAKKTKVVNKYDLVSQLSDNDIDSSKSSNVSSNGKYNFQNGINSTKIINTNTNSNQNTGTEITSEYRGLKPIWDKITNKSKEEYLHNSSQQSVSNNYINLLQSVLSCGLHFSSVINNKSNVLISMVATKDLLFQRKTYLFVLVKDDNKDDNKDHNQGKILYKFSKNIKSRIEMYVLGNQAKVLCKDNLNLSKDIVYKIHIYSQDRNIVIKFDNSHERNQWIQLLS